MNFYAVCIVHEMGHLLAIYITGGKVKSVIFSGTGVIINSIKRPNYELFIMLAGAGANLIVFFMLGILNISGIFRWLNLAIAVYNLLPYRQLDGGSALCILIDGTLNERVINAILIAIKIIFSVLLFGLSMFYNREFFPLFIVSVMLFVSERGIS